MASTWKQSITTSAGIALMNKAYGVSSIIPTKAVTITDDISGYSVTQLMALTSVNYNQSRVPIVVSNQANITRIGIDIDNKDVNEQYDYYGIGVYFKQVNTGEEVLFSVIPLTGAATIIPNQSGVATSSISIDSYTSIVPGTKVDLAVSDSGSVTRSDVEQIVAANQSYSFPKKPAASGIDFYTLKSVGIYQIKDDKTVVNAPDGFSGNGYIIVIGDGTTANPITQDLFDTVTGNKYSNSYDSDVNKWTGWEEMASKSDVTDLNNGLSTKVNTTDMRKPANDVLGLEDIKSSPLPKGTDLYTLINASGQPLSYHASTYASAQTMANKPTTKLNAFKLNTASIGDKTGSNFNYTFLTLIDYLNGSTYEAFINTNRSGAIKVAKPWYKVADDSTVVHITDMRKPASDVAGLEDITTAYNQGGIADGTDAQSINKEGLYQLNGISLINFIGSGKQWGTFQVIYQGGAIFQIARMADGSIYTNSYGGTPVSWGGWVKFADDSKVAHLSGANNFDTVPTVNNNPLLLASSLPSDLARTSQQTNFTAGLQSGGLDVATAADLKRIKDMAWREVTSSYFQGSYLFRDNQDGTVSLAGTIYFANPSQKYNEFNDYIIILPDGYKATGIVGSDSINTPTKEFLRGYIYSDDVFSIGLSSYFPGTAFHVYQDGLEQSNAMVLPLHTVSWDNNNGLSGGNITLKVTKTS